MILDNQAIFSDNQAITADASSTNILKAEGEIAYGTPVEIYVQVSEAFKSTEVDSVVVKLQTDDNASFSSPTTIVSETLPALTLGTVANLKFLPKGNEGYLRLYYDLTLKTGVSAATEGKILSGIVDGAAESHHN